MSVITTLRGRVARRFLFVYRADPAAVAPLLPRGLAPHEQRGETLLVLSYTRLEGVRSRWLPAPLGGHSDHLAWRVSVRRTSPGGACGVWIPRRDTSSRLGARCAGVLSRGGYHLSHFALDGGEPDLSLGVVSQGVELLHVRAQRAHALRGSVFATLRQAEERLADPGLVLSPDPLSPSLDRLALHGGGLALMPMQASEPCPPPFVRMGLLAPGRVELDCCLRVLAVRVLTRPLRDERSALNAAVS